MRKNITRVLFGIILISAAVILFGDSMQWWKVTDFDGWWTMFLIVPGVAGIISYGFSLWSTVLVLIGGWFLAEAQGWIPYPVSENMIWIVILLLVGLKLIFGSVRTPKITGAPVFFDGIKGASDSNNTVNYTAVFGSVEVANNSQYLSGGTLSAIFGGVDLDLRGAVPIDGAVIEANAVFGGVEIIAPQNCRINLVGTPFFGGAECTAPMSNDMSLPMLTIRYFSVFGGVEVK